MMGCDEEEMIALINNGAYHTLAMESVGLPATIHGDGPSGFTCFMSKEQVNGTCQYVSEPVMASTWNINLMTELGEATAKKAPLAIRRRVSRIPAFTRPASISTAAPSAVAARSISPKTRSFPA